MNVPTISMPREEARARLREYRRALHRRADGEYEQVAQAYEALAQGHAIVRLSSAIAGAPRDAQHRPRLAVARADRRQVRVYVRTTDARVQFTTKLDGRGLDNPSLTIEVDVGERAASWAYGYALVPIVPPVIRGTLDMRKHFILWEVEQWADQMIGAKPDIDPLLLRRLGGDVYAVVGQWDLTEVERMVLAGRALEGVR